VAGGFGASSATESKGKWLFSNVWAPATATEAESFLWYSVDDRLQVGVAYLWKQRAFRGMGSYKLVKETAKSPAITAGLGLQGIGTGNPGYFVTAEKGFSFKTGSASAYLGAGFRTNENHGHMLGGVKFTPLNTPWTLGLQADGHNLHPFVTHAFPEFTLGLYLVNMKLPGVLFSKRW
jgi:hypothetical protein